MQTPVLLLLLPNSSEGPPDAEAELVPNLAMLPEAAAEVVAQPPPPPPELAVMMQPVAQGVGQRSQLRPPLRCLWAKQ